MAEPNDLDVPQWSAAGPPPPPVKSRKKWIGYGVVGAFLLYIGISAIVGLASDKDSKDDSDPSPAPAVEAPQDHSTWAEVACENAVKDILKDPDSAKFSDALTTQHRDDPRSYEVLGSVNAKNSFGGYSGFQNYSCTATLSEDGETMNGRAILSE